MKPRKVVLVIGLFFFVVIATIKMISVDTDPVAGVVNLEAAIPLREVVPNRVHHSVVRESVIATPTLLNQPWISYPIDSAELESLGPLIGYGDKRASYQLIKIEKKYLDGLSEGDIFAMSVPDAPAVKMHITHINNNAKVRSVVGHLSGYSDAYYIGFTYDDNGNVYGDVTTESSNYSIRTYNNKIVIFKNFNDPHKSIDNDF